MEEGTGSGIISFVPILIIVLVFGLFAWPMTARKGLSRWYVLACFIPLVGPLIFVWIASKTDKAVLDELAALREKNEAR